MCTQEEASIKIHLTHPTRIEDFSRAMGGGIDGNDHRSTLSDSVVKQMLKAGLRPLSYRLRTELGIESWHWNPSGTWSDAAHHQGYWTSSTHSQAPITKSYGYRLPRRGNTLDEANNDGYSRLDDGNPNTFWKSNPYLTSHYTGESDFKHPQWILLDFGKPVLINAACLHWKDPFAKKYRIQYSCGGNLYFGHNHDWHDFPHGKWVQSSKGSSLLNLGTPHDFLGKPLQIQYLRILMTESSSSAMPGSQDPRDSMGYALSEIECGFLESGKFFDQIIHSPNQKQTVVYVSSTDPWHRACDRDERTQQPGLDLVARSGLRNTQPILWSVPLLYDTPENAAAEVDFLKARGYLSPSQRVELGEEPDGQRVDPKDVAELYAQTSQKIYSAHPDLSLGGLSFVTIDVNRGDLIYRVDKKPWLHRFFKQLKKKKGRKNFQFLTFEWYPFDDLLLPPAPLLINQPRRLKESVERIRRGGIPKTMPLMISEYGYSVFSGEPEVTLAAALLQADIAVPFLLLGGTTSYLYGYEPNYLECNYGNSWGNLMMFLQDKKKSKHLQPLPTYYCSRLLTHEWGPPYGGPCNLYSTTIKTETKGEAPYLSAYFLSSKNQGNTRKALLIINKNPQRAYRFKCIENRAFKTEMPNNLTGNWEYYSYSSDQYQWHSQGVHGHPQRNQPPLKSFCQGEVKKGVLTTSLEFKKNGVPIMLPPWSITVLQNNNLLHRDQ
jgi:hypothetical protein